MRIGNSSSVFVPVLAALEQFARDHGLLIERFRHGGPSLSFLFRHPRMGAAKIQVLPDLDDGYALIATWEVHDLPARKRMWKRSALNPVEADPHLVIEQLEVLLKVVVAWKEGDWTRVTQHLPEVTGAMITNAIERDSKLPLPR